MFKFWSVDRQKAYESSAETKRLGCMRFSFLSALIFVVTLGILFLADEKPAFATRNFARLIPVPEPGAEEAPWWSGFYLEPNETAPENLKPFLQLAPKGVYLSVGTERGFFGAALTRQVSHLLLVDVDPQVVLYNRLNIALLQAVTNQQDYLRLRQSKEYSAWQHAARILEARGFYESAQLLASQENFQFFQAGRSNGEILLSSKHPVQSPGAHRQTTPHVFGGEANYLVNADAFQKIHQMALNGLIQAEQGNLFVPKRLQEIVQALASQSLSLAVVDLSNIWDTYASVQEFTDFFKGIAPISQKTTLLLGSYVDHGSYFAYRLMKWIERGYSFENMAKIYRGDWHDGISFPQFQSRKDRVGTLDHSAIPHKSSQSRCELVFQGSSH